MGNSSISPRGHFCSLCTPIITTVEGLSIAIPTSFKKLAETTHSEESLSSTKRMGWSFTCASQYIEVVFSSLSTFKQYSAIFVVTTLPALIIFVIPFLILEATWNS
ncbi:hypothetical protein C2G38_2079754 [Gigaspora rosea]|uniref:Uncharacterized protein n=1 Tax=Gigaspora rosea TaxID=44941 RepID=A0A397VLT9_9GLOM|nr:hypothetical protein C2G38_2079754 [Gigaspora rosea]